MALPLQLRTQAAAARDKGQHKHAQQLFTEAAELFLPLVAQSSDRNRARVKEICEGCLESAASEKAKAADEEQDVGVPPQPPEIPEQLPPNPQAVRTS